MTCLPQKGIPSQRKEEMCTQILQAHMHIMIYGWSTEVIVFIWPPIGSDLWILKLLWKWIFPRRLFKRKDYKTRESQVASQGGRIRELNGVSHVLELAKILIFIGKTSDVGVNTIFKREACRMVQVEKFFLKGVQNTNTCNILGSISIDAYNSYIVPNSVFTR